MFSKPKSVLSQSQDLLNAKKPDVSPGPGTEQRCPFSPHLFNHIQTSAIQEKESKQEGYRSGKKKQGCLCSQVKTVDTEGLKKVTRKHLELRTQGKRDKADKAAWASESETEATS